MFSPAASCSDAQMCLLSLQLPTWPRSRRSALQPVLATKHSLKLQHPWNERQQSSVGNW